MIRLRVWANVRPMGWFGHANTEFFFEYDNEWLNLEDGYVLAPQFPLTEQRYTGNLVRSFFENLLPEGDSLEDILAAIKLRTANSLEVLAKLGKDLPGVLSILAPDDEATNSQKYTDLSYEELSRRLAARSDVPFLISNQQSTMSLAGAQDKLGIRLDEKSGKLYDSVGRSLSTHIAKPDTRQAKYRPSVINEYACMKLAKELKLPVPEVWLLTVPEPVYVVKRYDRKIVDGNIVPLHQIDGCQLLGHGAGWKYERQGGLASLPKLVQALRDLPVKGQDLLNFQRWVMFNFLIGNADAHAKNISILISDKGYKVADFYDLLCVRAYGDDSLALYIGDQETFDSVGAHSWKEMCEDCGFSSAPTLKELRAMANALMPAWTKVLKNINKQHPNLLANDHQLLEKMTSVFERHTQAAISMTEVGRQ